MERVRHESYFGTHPPTGSEARPVYGGEYNAVVKDRRAVDVRYALCFPDTYEIGMSNLGCRILYG